MLADLYADRGGALGRVGERQSGSDAEASDIRHPTFGMPRIGMTRYDKPAKGINVSEATESTETTEGTEETEPKQTQAQIDLARAVELVSPKAKAGASDEDMVIVLISEGGFGYKKAGRLLNLALVELGVRISAKDRYEQVCELLLENDFAPTEWSEVQSVVEYLAQEIDSTNEKQALVAVRKYAKENGIDLPKKPKSGGGAGRGRGFRGQIFDWLTENVTLDDDAFKAWMTENGKPESMTKRFLAFRETARKIHANMAAAGL